MPLTLSVAKGVTQVHSGTIGRLEHSKREEPKELTSCEREEMNVAEHRRDD